MQAQTSSPPRDIAQQFNTWWCYYGTFRIDTTWSVTVDAEFRRANGVSTWMQMLGRLSFNYALSQDDVVAAGYVFSMAYPYGAQPIALAEPRPEHRLWEQITLRDRRGRLELFHRFRLEHRFLQAWTDVNPDTGLRQLADEFALEHRLRYRFLIAHPLASNEAGTTVLFANLREEAFVNIGTPNFNVFEQNRIGLMLGWQFSSWLNVQVGYINQILFKANGRDAEMNHTLAIFFTSNLDFETQ
jgi:hypothetical protein